MWSKVTTLATASAAVLCACAVDPRWSPELELAVGREVSTPDIGGSVTGVARLRQPLIPGRLYLGYEHISALGTAADTHLDQVELILRVPLPIRDGR
jgi:hypothetical protein